MSNRDGDDPTAVGLHVTELTSGLILVRVDESAPGLAAGMDARALSATEQAVVRLAARGLSNGEIAARRGCSRHTIAKHLASAYRKLGLSGRRELRARLTGRGLPE